ncbi:MAG TPA: hypothetical protein PLN52_17045, partial [Opitutaceae bacterium]|nr:hypothetical protein [Opitutaceae bacterium]
VLLYVSARILQFDPVELQRVLTTAAKEQFVTLRLSDEQVLSVLAQGYRTIYTTVAIVTILYQGGMALYYHRRRGAIQGMENKTGACIITAHVPLELLFGYVTDIRSLSKGRASASITPSHFEQVPNSLLAKIVETSSKAPARS